MAKLIVGPVIGKVTATTGRVLVESDREASGVVCRARAKGHTVVSKPLDLPRGRPVVFALRGLRPSTRYALEFRNVQSDVAGSVRTFGRQPRRMNLAAVSCNFTTRSGGTDLWADMRDRFVAKEQIDLLLHMGDQVYGDNAFQQALGILGGRARGTARDEHQILESYRWLYRWTWGHPPTREVLASVPNLMIWDDHEIRDDWGSRASDKDPATAEYYVGALARRVFWEYQRQLWADVPTGAPSELHHHRWGPIGVLLVDQRGARSFTTDRARPYLGSAQWAEIRRLLRPGGSLDRVRALVVVTSVPLVYLAPGVASAGDVVVDDLRDHWSWESHQTEQVEMLRALRQWKQRGGGDREVLILGGDVHLGGYTDISHDGERIFKQLISSPITNRPPNWFFFQGIRGFLELGERIGGRYTFEHHDFTRQRNYGVILVRVPRRGEVPLVDGSLVQAA